MHTSRTTARLLAAGLFAGALALAAPAAAHVSVSPSTTEAGGYAILTFSVPHGCDGSATTKLAIDVPEQITSVTPTRNPLWDVVVESEKLDEPNTDEPSTDAHGNTVTERDATVVYTAKDPLPDGYRDAFELSVQLPDDPGATLLFPTVQTCEKGESAWIEVPEEGQDPDELELPAPSVTISAAESASAEETAAAEEPASADEPAEQADESDGGFATTMALLAFLTGAVGLVAGTAALAQVRRRD